jgi:hypothetical protein
MTPPSASISLTRWPLADAADRRVAAHLSQRFDILRQQQRLRAPTRGWRARAASDAGVTAAYDNDIRSAAFLVRDRGQPIRVPLPSASWN